MKNNRQANGVVLYLMPWLSNNQTKMTNIIINNEIQAKRDPSLNKNLLNLKKRKKLFLEGDTAALNSSRYAVHKNSKSYLLADSLKWYKKQFKMTSFDITKLC